MSQGLLRRRSALEVDAALLERLSQFGIGQVPGAALGRGAQCGGRAGGLTLAHAADGVPRGHVCPVIGGNHHPGDQEVVYLRRLQCPVRNPVGSAPGDLESRG